MESRLLIVMPSFDLGDAVLDVLLLAGAVDDRVVFLVDHHFLGFAETSVRSMLTSFHPNEPEPRPIAKPGEACRRVE
jgi:hypothetical protein